MGTCSYSDRATGLTLLPAWLRFAPLSSVVQAFVKVDLNQRPVQHAEGGIVRKVLVRDGQRVKQGEPLLVLGDGSADAGPNRLNCRVIAERASHARLEAEPESLTQAVHLKLLVGMPAEVYIVGEECTPLQYLIEPVTQILRNAVREQ